MDWSIEWKQHLQIWAIRPVARWLARTVVVVVVPAGATRDQEVSQKKILRTLFSWVTMHVEKGVQLDSSIG